ncbi:MAG: glycosyltransferase [Actinomycetota bacterium]|nr:glycosyltransferase [Actinomycetota bacterium]
MSRPPHPPSKGKLADLARRGRLTLEHHGPRELALRIVTFPLRPTPIGARLGYGSKYGSLEALARRWYRRNWRPVTAVIPSYGDPGLAIQAAESLRRTTRRGRLDVVIVDDASPDPAHAARLHEHEGAEIVVLEENRGFAGAVNAGIARAPADRDVVVLNSDVIARRAWLPRLQHAAYAGPRIGIAGPKLVYPDERIQSAGSYRNLDAPQWFDHRYRFKDSAHPPANIPLPVLGATGACMYLRRDMLDEVGLFDEAYGMAFEDMDLCLRAWDAGWETVYAPRSTLEHLESQTRPLEPGERELASQRLFWQRWKPWFDERDVRTPDGGLRIVYVTEDTGVGGGHRDIFEHINRLRERGHDAQLYSLGGRPDWFELDGPVHTFEEYSDLQAALEDVDAIKVATWWNTGHKVWRASVRRGIPVFFVQDVETSYYPGDENMRQQVVASYRQEFRYMTISGHNAEGLAGLGLRSALVPPGIDLETFRPLEGVRRRDDMLLALGRSNPLKNFPLTVDAWRALGPGGPELTLFGTEPEVAPEGRVRYVEKPSDGGVNALFNECTVFLQTSTHEGFCLPPLEAMATGAAAVCTDAHGNRDFCVDGGNCLMPEQTVESVSGALRRLLADPALRERLGRAGIETAADYAWERRIDELEAFYESIVAGTTLPAP